MNFSACNKIFKANKSQTQQRNEKFFPIYRNYYRNVSGTELLTQMEVLYVECSFSVTGRRALIFIVSPYREVFYEFFVSQIHKFTSVLIALGLYLIQFIHYLSFSMQLKSNWTVNVVDQAAWVVESLNKCCIIASSSKTIVCDVWVVNI